MYMCRSDCVFNVVRSESTLITIHLKVDLVLSGLNHTHAIFRYTSINYKHDMKEINLKN